MQHGRTYESFRLFIYRGLNTNFDSMTIFLYMKKNLDFYDRAQYK